MECRSNPIHSIVWGATVLGRFVPMIFLLSDGSFTTSWGCELSVIMSVIRYR